MKLWRRLLVGVLAIAILVSCNGDGAMSRAASTASSLVAPTDTAQPTNPQPAPAPDPGPVYTPPIRPLVGPLRVVNGTVWDATGPRRIVGYSDFPALRIWEDDRAEAERTLDAAQRAGYQFVRIGVPLVESETQNNGYWRGAHVSPELAKRTLVPFARAAYARGIRLHIFGAYDFGSRTAELDFARWVGAALRDSGLADAVALYEWRNEWNLTSPWRLSQESLDVARQAMTIMRDALGCLTSVGSPGEDDPWIARTIFDGALAAIDGMRGMSGPLYMKHANGFYYRGRYQGVYRGAALWVTEPTGFDGVDGDVYLPLNDKEFLYGLYATYVVSGQVLTTFNGQGVRHRRPLDSVWGFYELPRLLSQIPEDIGTWRGPTWFVKDTHFVAVLAEEWGEEKCPDYPRCRPIKSWEFVTLNGLRIGGTGPIKLAPGWKAGIFLGEW